MIESNYFEHPVLEGVFERNDILVVPAVAITALRAGRVSLEQLFTKLDQVINDGKKVLIFENTSTELDVDAMCLANTIFSYAIGRFGLSRENIRYVTRCQPDSQHTAAMINHINSKLYVMPSLFSLSVPNDKNTLVKLN